MRNALAKMATSPENENQTCPRCGSSAFVTKDREFADGTHHIEQRCGNGHFIKFVSQGKPLEVMPFGKYCNRPIKELPDDYLNWILENCELKNNLRRHLEAEFERRGDR
jgi:ribosomal protein S27AE